MKLDGQWQLRCVATDKVCLQKSPVPYMKRYLQTEK